MLRLSPALYPLFSLFFISCFPFLKSELPATQRATLLDLSKLLGSWDVDKNPNPCSWKGVGCNFDNSSVTNITLSGSSLSSDDVLPVICQIDTLQALDVSHNSLNHIPEKFIELCGAISGLRLLNFSNNRLVGPLPSFVGFERLEILDLSFNCMNGNIDLQLDELVSLKSLNLSSNSFSGPLPTKIGRDRALEQLQLSKNQFRGTISEDIVRYMNLTFIDMSSNYLSGSLPLLIGNLSKLEFLILSANKFNGEIPESVSRISSLVRLAAHENRFIGNLPIGITNYVKNLDLSYNNISGSIPVGLLSKPQLETVDLSHNELEGPIPGDVSSSSILVRLRLGSNMLNGTIPATFGKLQKLMYLELDNNKLTGVIPNELGACKILLLLNLAQNNLEGRLPSQLGNLQGLQALRLESNNLSGELPLEIMQLRELMILNLGWNSLNGSIPHSILVLNRLVNLNLQGNYFVGAIPDTIREMSSLMELQLGGNQLTNPIPKMPEKLQIALNLSSNRFEGLIPKSFVGLPSLEVLDLSNNQFSGEIPAYLVQLVSLTELSLTNNQLSGVIPPFRTWVLLDTKGNPNLIPYTTPIDTSPPLRKKRKPIIAAIGVVIVALFISAAFVIFIFVMTKRYYKGNVHDSEGEVPPTAMVIQGKLLSLNVIHRSNIDFSEAMEAVSDPSNIDMKTRLCTYYKVVMPRGSSYYVKKLKWNDKIVQPGSRDKFGKEMEVLGRLNNSNIMTPLAYVLTTESTYLFFEYAPKGTLFDNLHGSLGNVLDWSSRYSIAIGAAQGLTFLHGCASGPVLLLDLSSKNIFLKSLKEPQIGDIELCKVIDPSKSTGSLSMVPGSVGYIPPEYAYTMRVSPAGNVYSFGVILLELLTGKTAISEGAELVKTVLGYHSKQNQKWELQILDNSISKTSPYVRSQMGAVLEVAISCVSPSPESRPKMKTVLRMLLNAR
ncbi:leucine-rich repeat receptor-like tyrosine-protein kinase PXC3 [Cucurbita pepo subsp. pepo]|uniref:leucine-rich repeat receptor-like tyrosine-protein kinase PXC3 n=1 Tax=Cucurbita pepo subsp. pepo TaxID=3664 RepID=UPI000C9D97D0|nr:leucine-rich repeat receptor-like tyrosine-protein kinase PXC3 [Cucurbita pepo subsp. pepo]